MIISEKQRQRQQGKAARRGLDKALRETYSRDICRRVEALPCFQRAQRVLVYAAFGGEVSLEYLTKKHGEKTFFYPLCLSDFQMQALCPHSSEDWEVGAYGIRTPIAASSETVVPEELDLVLVPCTAFDDECRRVGMGAGYYDRYLMRCVNAVKLGVAFECQKVERAAVDEFDVWLDGYVTEERCYNACTPREEKRNQHGKNDNQNL